MDRKTSVALLAARVGLGITFLFSGLGKLAAWSGTVAYAGGKGVAPSLLAIATALEILGAVSILAGWKTRWGALALLVFLAPVTVVFHGFWAYAGADAQMQLIQFLKNASIAGGLLAVLAAGPGAISVDARASRAARRGVAGAELGA